LSSDFQGSMCRRSVLTCQPSRDGHNECQARESAGRPLCVQSPWRYSDPHWSRQSSPPSPAEQRESSNGPASPNPRPSCSRTLTKKGRFYRPGSPGPCLGLRCQSIIERTGSHALDGGAAQSGGEWRREFEQLKSQAGYSRSEPGRCKNNEIVCGRRSRETP